MTGSSVRPLCVRFLAGAVVLSGCASSSDSDGSESSESSTKSSSPEKKSKGNDSSGTADFLRAGCKKTFAEGDLCDCTMDSLDEAGEIEEDMTRINEVPREVFQKTTKQCLLGGPAASDKKSSRDKDKKSDSASVDSKSLTPGSSRLKVTEDIKSDDSSKPQDPSKPDLFPDLSTPSLDGAVRDLEKLEESMPPMPMVGAPSQPTLPRMRACSNRLKTPPTATAWSTKWLKSQLKTLNRAPSPQWN